jgi:hypothetical protein
MTEEEHADLNSSITDRIAVAAQALQDESELWMTTVDGEVVLDTEIAAAIVLRVLVEHETQLGCMIECHVVEHHRVMAALRSWADKHPSRGPIVEDIEMMMEGEGG